MLLRARAEEGSDRSDRARQLIESCLRVDPDLLPAVRDAMEYELCAGNWARAWELASAIGSDDNKPQKTAAGTTSTAQSSSSSIRF